jgi:phage anti-repressor protein
MQELKVIENNLVPVYETSNGEKVVYGSELHEVLEVKSKFADWIKNRLNDCDAAEKEDFETFSKILEKGRPTVEYIVKLDTAKEMAMLERNDKGKQVRKYFIAVEKKYNNRMKVPMTIPEQIQLLAMGNVELNQKVDDLDKKIDRLELDLPILGIEIDRITSAAKKKGVECLGGKNSEAYQDKSLRGKVYNDIYRELKRQFGVSTYKAIKRSQCDTAVSIIGEYQLPYVLLEQVQLKNSQLGLWGGGKHIMSKRAPKLKRKEILSTINTYCEKNNNDFVLVYLMKAAELFYKMYDNEDYASLTDLDWDKALALLDLIQCNDEKKVHNIKVILGCMMRKC